MPPSRSGDVRRTIAAARCTVVLCTRPSVIFRAHLPRLSVAADAQVAAPPGPRGRSLSPLARSWRIRSDIEEEEDPVCPKPEVEEACKPKCINALMEYEACVKRIESDTTGEAHCTGQYFDYFSCIDACAAKPLFDKLK